MMKFKEMLAFLVCDGAAESRGLPRPVEKYELANSPALKIAAAWPRERIAVYCKSPCSRRGMNLLNKLAIHGWAIMFYDPEIADFAYRERFGFLLGRCIRSRLLYVRPGRRIKHDSQTRSSVATSSGDD